MLFSIIPSDVPHSGVSLSGGGAHTNVSSKNGLPEYLGYVYSIEYEIKICHKNVTILVWIKTRVMKRSSQTPKVL